MAVIDNALEAVRAGLGFCQKVNKKDSLDSQTVLTDAGLLKTTSSGYRDIITGVYAHLNTASDWCEFEVGYTANADGSGAFTALTPLFRIETPANNDSAAPQQMRLDNTPICIEASDGGAWTIRAQTNDAAASVTFALNGWREET